MEKQSIEELFPDIPLFTRNEFDIEKAELLKRFQEVHKLNPEEIDDVIKNFRIEEDDLVQQWISLHALEPYL